MQNTILQVIKEAPIPKPEYAPLDINIARHQIFAPSDFRGYRKLEPWTDTENGVRVVRQVGIGTFEDTDKTLNPLDEKVLLAAALNWRKRGEDMDDRRVCGSLANKLRQLANGKKSKFGAARINAIKEAILKLSGIPITYTNSYESARGWETKTITLFERVRIFNRKESIEAGGKYIEETEIVLNSDFCANIKAGKIKLYNLEQIFGMRGEIPGLILRRLEMYLSQIYPRPFRKDLLEFADEVGIKYKKGRERDVLRRFKGWCKVIKGETLSDGYVADCEIETSLGKSGWNFVAKWGKPSVLTVTIPAPVANAPTPRPVLTREQMEFHRIVAEEDELLEIYGQLPDEEKRDIDQRTKILHQKIYHGWGNDRPARLDAIREHRRAKDLVDDIAWNTLRERPRNFYLCAGERAVYHSLAEALKKVVAQRAIDGR